MEFLYEYGLFLAKSVTVLAAIVVVISLMASLGSRNHSRPRGRIVVTQLNERLDDVAERMLSVALDEKALKKHSKEKKKAEKSQRKGGTQGADGKVAARKKRAFVLTFDGDVKASATEELRESITAVLTLAEPHDEVVLKLESQGGMVHSYGLAASQLKRITAKQIPLTVCVDKVAASGGYMMACVADKIIAAPFAIIGSIGVVAQLPNFHRVLKKNDIDYELLTAGEYKRTLTVFGENTEKGRQKFKEDLEDVHVLFKEFIKENRSTLDVDAVATGEIWFGKRALDVRLVDVLQTSDEYLTDMHPAVDIFAVEYEHKKTLPEKFGIAAATAVEASVLRFLKTVGIRHWS